MWRRRGGLLVVLAVVLGGAALFAVDGNVPLDPQAADRPAVSDRLIPREGAWWGSYPGQRPGDVEAREAVYGRRVDILHRYHDWDDTWPTAEERAYASQGRFLFEGWESRVFGGGTVCWADIAAGGHDAAVDAQARRLAAFGDPLFVGFMHEPEDNAGACRPGAGGGAGAAMGSAEEFKAAWRRIVARVLKAVVLFDRLAAPVPGADPYLNQPHK
jgi:hypothetical protein